MEPLIVTAKSLYPFINIKRFFPARGDEVATFERKTIAIYMADIWDVMTATYADNR